MLIDEIVQGEADLDDGGEELARRRVLHQVGDQVLVDFGVEIPKSLGVNEGMAHRDLDVLTQSQLHQQLGVEPLNEKPSQGVTQGSAALQFLQRAIELVPKLAFSEAFENDHAYLFVLVNQFSQNPAEFDVVIDAEAQPLEEVPEEVLNRKGLAPQPEYDEILVSESSQRSWVFLLLLLFLDRLLEADEIHQQIALVFLGLEVEEVSLLPYYLLGNRTQQIHSQILHHIDVELLDSLHYFVHVLGDSLALIVSDREFGRLNAVNHIEVPKALQYVHLVELIEADGLFPQGARNEPSGQRGRVDQPFDAFGDAGLFLGPINDVFEVLLKDARIQEFLSDVAQGHSCQEHVAGVDGFDEGVFVLVALPLHAFFVEKRVESRQVGELRSSLQSVYLLLQVLQNGRGNHLLGWVSHFVQSIHEPNVIQAVNQVSLLQMGVISHHVHVEGHVSPIDHGPQFAHFIQREIEHRPEERGHFPSRHKAVSDHEVDSVIVLGKLLLRFSVLLLLDCAGNRLFLSQVGGKEIVFIGVEGVRNPSPVQLTCEINQHLPQVLLHELTLD